MDKKVLCPDCGEDNSLELKVCKSCGFDLLLKDRYCIVKVLGQNIGLTYKAYDIESDKDVIIKELSLRNIKKWKTEELFNREGEVLSQLNHPLIPTLLDKFSSGVGRNGRLYLVMEYISGVNLEVERGSKYYTIKEVLETVKGISELLKYIHSLHPPIIHRDLKPSNLIRTDDNKIALIDFGAVKDVFNKDGGSTIAGTLGYMAPEQFMGKAVKSSDYYSLGVIMITLLSKKSPEEIYDGFNFKWENHVDISGGIKVLISKLLEQSLDKRTSSIDEIIELTDRVMNSEDSDKTLDKVVVIDQKSDKDFEENKEVPEKDLKTLKSYLKQLNLKGANPLIKVAKKGDFDLVKELLELGADIEQVGDFDENLLHYGIESDNIEFITYLIDKGIDIDKRNINGQTPFMFALREKKVEIIDLLLERGVNLNKRDKKGRTALMIIANIGDFDLFKKVFEKMDSFDQIDNRGDNTLFYAYRGGNRGVVQFLLEKNVINIDQKDSMGETLLIKTSRVGDDYMVDLILNLEPNLELKDNEHETALFNAIKGRHYNIFRKLVAINGDINTQDELGWTPLMKAISYRDADLIQFILDSGGDKDIKNSFGDDIVKIAKRMGYSEVLKMF